MMAAPCRPAIAHVHRTFRKALADAVHNRANYSHQPLNVHAPPRPTVVPLNLPGLDQRQLHVYLTIAQSPGCMPSTSFAPTRRPSRRTAYLRLARVDLEAAEITFGGVTASSRANVLKQKNHPPRAGSVPLRQH